MALDLFMEAKAISEVIQVIQGIKDDADEYLDLVNAALKFLKEVSEGPFIDALHEVADKMVELFQALLKAFQAVVDALAKALETLVNNDTDNEGQVRSAGFEGV